MKNQFKGLLPTCTMVLIVLALSFVIGVIAFQSTAATRKKETDNTLNYYNENIILKLQEKLNEADALARAASLASLNDTVWFETAAASLMLRDEVVNACLFVGDTVVSSLPAESFGDQIGQDLKDFSYIYTMAKVVKNLVVEGPVTIDSASGEQEVFLFLQPLVEGDTYLGEVVVALDKNYVMTELAFETLIGQGYDYELWRVNSQNGGKEVVAVSNHAVDFSHAVKTKFYLPTEWNLSIQPTYGWVSMTEKIWIISACGILAILLLIVIYSLYMLFRHNRTLKELSFKDSQTGLLNKKGFLRALQNQLRDEPVNITLFYFVFEGYDQICQIIEQKEEDLFLKRISERLRNYINHPYVAGRLGIGHFIIAVYNEMDDMQSEDFAKGISLELLLKTRINNRKTFLAAKYQYMRCSPTPSNIEDALKTLRYSYHKKHIEESSLHKLTEKCRALIEGRNDITFEEYADPEMMELSKVFNQYCKQVEQLAYHDQFHAGNRPKYLRDTNMLISYDKKRKFSLFSIDICSFGQYNQLFSTVVGDEILKEVVHRLSRVFGTYLYRINGDVFLGICLSGEDEESMTQKLNTILSEPISAGSTSLALQVRIAVCRYPEDGDSPDVLLDRIQSTLLFSKESGRNIVQYNNMLENMIQTESDISHRLETAIREETLQVWYQPIFQLSSSRFTAAEALVRLEDGVGGYFSAGQVVALAERSGIIELLGDYVLSKACQFISSYSKNLGILRICVNISVQQLIAENSAERLLDIIRASGVDANQITLEITESILIQSIERATNTLNKLRQAGIHIALDDFGVGYSSLNYLLNLPVDVIKIDRSLTQQICTNPKQYAMLHSIVDMAGINALTIVSEGVENEEEQKLVAASGIQYIQGFYYAHPMKQGELYTWLHERY